jgi:hypothetical protein
VIVETRIMKKLTMKTSMLGLFAISAAMSVGCAAGSEPGGSEDQGVGAAEQPQIAAIGAPIINGCNVSQMFNINNANNSAQNADFIAVQGQNLQDLQLALFTQSSAGTWNRLDQAAQTMSASMQSLLAQAAQASSTIVNQAASSNSTIANAQQSSGLVQSANTQTQAQQSSQASESDNTVVTHDAHADQSAAANNLAAQAANQLAFSNFASAAGVGGGFFSNGSSAQGASANNFLQQLANSASSNNVSTVDTVHHDAQAQQASQMSASTSSNSAVYQNSQSNSALYQNATASSLAAQATQSSLYQNAADSTNSNAATSASSNQAFTNLASQNIQNVRLLVSFNQAAQSSAANIFTGANQSVFANASFSPVLGSCGASVVTPSIVAAPIGASVLPAAASAAF